MKSHSKVRIEESIENEDFATILVDPKTFFELKPTQKKSEIVQERLKMTPKNKKTKNFTK